MSRYFVKRYIHIYETTNKKSTKIYQQVIDRTYWYHEDSHDGSEDWEWEEIEDDSELPTDEELKGIIFKEMTVFIHSKGFTKPESV